MLGVTFLITYTSTSIQFVWEISCDSYCILTWKRLNQKLANRIKRIKIIVLLNVCGLWLNIHQAQSNYNNSNHIFPSVQCFSWYTNYSWIFLTTKQNYSKKKNAWALYIQLFSLVCDKNERLQNLAYFYSISVACRKWFANSLFLLSVFVLNANRKKEKTLFICLF